MALTDNPRLTFKMTLPTKSQERLIIGRLYFQQINKRQLEFNATSGVAKCQFFQSYVMAGRGPIPPSNAIGNLVYKVDTDRLWYPLVKGIEGSSYKIYPDIIPMYWVTRSNFEIHYDSNVPGTAGCVGLTKQEHWDDFRQLMLDLSNEGIGAVPLEVVYA